MRKIVFTMPRRPKRRKYPIIRDDRGRSARQRAFEAFKGGKKPVEVATMVPISVRTARRYYADWKKLPQNLEMRYRILKAAYRRTSEFSPETIEALSSHLGMTEGEVIERLERPWGLKQLLMGEWPDRRQERERTEAETRLRAALTLINLMESAGVAPEQILKHLLALGAEHRVPVVPPES